MDVSKQYDTSFTPEGKKEAPKFCPGCNRGLPAAKFKMKYVTRNNVRGILRNRCCRECEDHSRKDIVEKSVDTVLLESRIKELENTVKSQSEAINDIQIILGSLSAKMIKFESIKN